MRRRTHPGQPGKVVTGWVEVWTTTPDDGFALEGSVPITASRLKATFEDGHYRLRERRSLELPRGDA